MKLTVTENGKVRLEDSQPEKPLSGYCVFSVKACGFCGSDMPRLFAGGAHVYPLVIGHEFSGVVEDSLDRSLIGKRACVFPILSCGHCEACRNMDYACCTGYDYYGSRRDGGMQNNLLIKESNLVFMPDGIGFEAGAMTEPSAVCLHAVRKAGISSGDKVAVFGAGTIGMLCAMWAKIKGAEEVYLSDIDEKKILFAEKLGFGAYRDQTVNVCIEASGAAIMNAIHAVKPFGRVVLVGNASKDICLTRETYSHILRKQLTVFGSWNSDFKPGADDWWDSLCAMADGILRPENLITHRYRLEDALSAVAMLAKREEMIQKVMVTM